MLVDLQVQIKRRQSKVAPAGKPEPNQRIDDTKRLERLLRVEIVPFKLVGKIKARADYRDTPDAAGAEHPPGSDSLERPLNGEVGKYRRVGRESPVVKAQCWFGGTSICLIPGEPALCLLTEVLPY